mmetsp:Transcript_94437/g.202753  ORF Transcript_94437/g.202753 Transcript_94437/m.202753 type:complete len:256 (-) Transcript_94437:397-1164(-)
MRTASSTSFSSCSPAAAAAASATLSRDSITLSATSRLSRSSFHASSASAYFRAASSNCSLCNLSFSSSALLRASMASLDVPKSALMKSSSSLSSLLHVDRESRSEDTVARSLSRDSALPSYSSSCSWVSWSVSLVASSKFSNSMAGCAPTQARQAWSCAEGQQLPPSALFSSRCAAAVSLALRRTSVACKDSTRNLSALSCVWRSSTSRCRRASSSCNWRVILSRCAPSRQKRSINAWFSVASRLARSLSQFWSW